MKITNREDREKRDWSLLIFIIPVGIFLMIIAGQIAIRIVPDWSVHAGMLSSLDLNSAPNQQAELIQPILSDILTPMSWFDTFLTPKSNSSDNVVFPPFIVFEASASPSPVSTASASATDAVTDTSTVPATTDSPSPTVAVTPPPTKTKKPKDPPPPPAVCTDPLATNNGGPLPCTYPPTPPTTCTDPLANNNGGPLPCTYTPVPSSLVGIVSPTPAGYNYGAPDGTIGNISDGTYIVINLSPNPIIVNGPSDTNYDFVYYEQPSGYGIQMDRVILSISTDNTTYYVVFNWGDGIADTNSNVGDVAATSGTENDNQPIDIPDTGELYGTDPLDTGILVDVDNAPSHPPVGSYNYLAIQAPAAPASTDGLGMDSVEVTEVPSPWP